MTIESSGITPGYYAHSRPELVRQIEVAPGQVVLDLGCGEGAVSRVLRESGRAQELWGVEIEPRAAALAEQALDRLLVGDLELLTEELPRDYFTHILAGDVLEHLVDPWTTLAKLRLRLRPGGRFVCSLPNIRNGSFFLELLVRRSFAYRDSGVLDRTHLRFFARKDARRMFEEAGFEQIRIGPARPKKRLSYRLARALLGDLAIKVFLITARRGAE